MGSWAVAILQSLLIGVKPTRVTVSKQCFQHAGTSNVSAALQSTSRGAKLERGKLRDQSPRYASAPRRTAMQSVFVVMQPERAVTRTSSHYIQEAIKPPSIELQDEGCFARPFQVNCGGHMVSRATRDGAQCRGHTKRYNCSVSLFQTCG